MPELRPPHTHIGSGDTETKSWVVDRATVVPCVENKERGRRGEEEGRRRVQGRRRKETTTEKGRGEAYTHQVKTIACTPEQ